MQPDSVRGGSDTTNAGARGGGLHFHFPIEDRPRVVFNVRRVMGMILDIKKFAIHDGPGIRTTVFFKGCPLDCWWCHNPESRRAEPEAVFRASRCIRCARCVQACANGAISMNDDRPHIDARRCSLDGACAEACPTEARQIIGRELTVEDVMRHVRQDLVFYDESGGGVTISGGEPLIQPQFLRELLKAAAAEGIHTAVDTTGYAAPETFRQAVEDADLLLYDLKLMDDGRHRDCCGVSNAPIVENLRGLARDGRAVVVRVPLVPGVNDDDAELERIGAFVAELDAPYPVDVLPYERRGLHKYEMLRVPNRMGDAQPPSEECVTRAIAILRNAGLQVTVRGEAYECE